MAIEIATSGATGNVSRTTNLLDYNSAYTVTFRFYKPGAQANEYIWGLGRNGQWLSYQDGIKYKGGGNVAVRVYNSPSVPEDDIGAGLSTGWHSVAFIRTNATTAKVRIDGTNYSLTGTDITGRTALQIEVLLGASHYSGASLGNGCKITNYKSWTAALTDGEVDAEMLTTTVSVSSGLFSVSPMGDEATLAGNLTQTGSGSEWSAGAGMTFGSNDPAVTYSGGGAALMGQACL